MYKGDKFKGDLKPIFKNKTLRINRQGEFKEVNLTRDPYGQKTAERLTDRYKKMGRGLSKDYDKLTKILNTDDSKLSATKSTNKVLNKAGRSLNKIKNAKEENT